MNLNEKSLGAGRQVNLGRNVAVKLATRPFFRSGRNVTADNCFTGKDLSDILFTNDLTYVGTVRGNKWFLPESFKDKLRGLPLHSNSFVFQTTTLVNYQSKANKNVVTTSTMHHDAFVDPGLGIEEKT